MSSWKLHIQISKKFTQDHLQQHSTYSSLKLFQPWNLCNIITASSITHRGAENFKKSKPKNSWNEMNQFHEIFFWYFPFYLLVHKHTTFFIFMGKCSREKYREIESFDFTIFLVLDILEFSDLLCIMKRSQRKLVSYTSFGFWELPTCSSDTFALFLDSGNNLSEKWV